MLSPTIRLHQLGFCPDLPSNEPGILVDMNGMVPTEAGVRTLPGLQLVILPLPGIIGIFEAQLNTGLMELFAGTALHLYIRVGGGWQENDGGQIFNATQGRWRFAQFLNDTIATDGVDPIQVSQAGGVFAALAGTPPIGKFVAVVDPGGIGAVAFIFNTVAAPDGWYASSPGNDTGWTLQQSNQSFFGRLAATPGPITGGAQINNGMAVFKASALYFGVFIGGQFGWNFQPISKQVGCASNEAIIEVGDFLAFVGPDDFYTFDGANLNPIPNKLRQWFFKNLDRNNASLIQGFYDSSNNVCTWYFPSTSPPTGTLNGQLDRFVSWNTKTGAWASGFTPTTANGVAAVLGVIDQFGQQTALTYGQFGTLYGFYGAIPAGLLYGSPSFSASPILNSGIVLGDGGVYQFSGAVNGTPYVRFGDFGDPEHYIGVDQVKPLFNVFPVKGQVWGRGLPPLQVLPQGSVGTAPSPSAATLVPSARLHSFVRDALGLTPFDAGDVCDLNDDFAFDPRESARWHQFKITFYDDAEIIGFAVSANDEGIR